MLFVLALIGLAVGLVGTLVGAGGGFLVVPILVLVFKVPPILAAGTSLVMVTINALSGSFAHIRRGKVDYRAALLLSAASYPGALLGAWVATRIDAGSFNLVFGLLLIVLSAWMTWRMLRGTDHGVAATTEREGRTRKRYWQRRIRLKDGTAYSFAFSVPLAVSVSFVIGLIGALLGIGGGPLIVPFMIFALSYPPHVAAATAQLTIALTSSGAAAIYALKGNLIMPFAIALSLGVLVGSPLGAWLSTRIKARNLVWFMIGILLLLGLRLVL
jgi:uncharacterized membrane protein YfcA